MAGKIVGVAGVQLPDLLDNCLDRLDIIRHTVERVERYESEFVHIHYAGDVNDDHRRLHKAVLMSYML